MASTPPANVVAQRHPTDVHGVRASTNPGTR